jgi:hypothetical protein
MLLPHGRPKINVLEFSKNGLLVKNSFSEMSKYKLLSKNGGEMVVCPVISKHQLFDVCSCPMGAPSFNVLGYSKNLKVQIVKKKKGRGGGKMGVLAVKDKQKQVEVLELPQGAPR